MSRILYSYTGL